MSSVRPKRHLGTPRITKRTSRGKGLLRTGPRLVVDSRKPMSKAALNQLRRAVRFGLYALGGVAALLAVALGAALFVLAHLESPAVKQRIVAAAAGSGIALDYEEASVGFGSLHFTKVRVAQPPPDEQLEPLFAVEKIDLSYSAWAAIFGGRVKLKSGSIDGVRAVIFSDDNGETSFTRLLARMPPSAPKKKETAAPLSTALAQLSTLAAEVDHFKLGSVSASMIERKGLAVAKQTDFAGLELTASAPQGGLDVRIASPEAGALVTVTTGAEKKQALTDFHAELIWSARGKPPHGSFEMDAKLRHQDLVAMPLQSPDLKTLLSLHAGVTPEPGEGRTRIVIEKLDLLEGAGSGHLDADLFDDGKGGVRPSIHELVLDLVLERFRPFIPLSNGTISALSGAMNVRIFGIDLSKGLRIAPDGGAEVKAEIPRLSWKQGSQSAEVTRAKFSLKAKPAAGGAALELEMPIELIRLERGRQGVLLSNADMKGQAHATFAYRVTGGVTARIGSLKVVGAQTIDAEDTECRLSLKDADLAAEGPLKISGGVNSELDFRHLLAKANGLAVDGKGVRLRAPMRVGNDAASGSGEVHFESDQVGVKRAGKPGTLLLVPTNLSADLKLARFKYDAKDARRSTADLTLAMAVGAVQMNLHADKKARELDYEMSAKAPSLAIAKPFSNPRNEDGTEQIPWQQIGLTFASKGSVANLGGGNAQRIAQETSLGISRGALHVDGIDVAFAQLSATLKSHGTPLVHEADLAMQMSGLAVQNEAREGEENLALHALIDRPASNAKVHFEAKGEAGPEGKLDFVFGFDSKASRVSYAIDGELHRLDLVPLFLPPSATAHTDLEWATLDLSLSGKGEMTGVVTEMRDFKPKLAVNPIRTMRGAQTFELKIAGLDYSNDTDQALVLSAAALHLDAREEDAGKHVELTASAPSGEMDAAGVQAKFEALQSAMKIDLGNESLRAEVSMKFGSLKQDSQPAYPVGDASFDALVTSGADGTIHIDHMKLDNVAGGTTLSASGIIEAMLQFTDGAPKLRPINPGGDVEQRDLKLTGELLQRMETIPLEMGFTGRGTMRVPFSAESNDFRYFRVGTGLEFKDADINLPARKISLGKLNAKIPVRLNFRLDEAGTIPLGGARPGVYSRERFVDYQPFLSSEDFISCETLTFGDSTLGPLAANLRVDRNVIALDQLEMSAFGGKITGQFLVDLDLANRQLTDVQFRGNVTGLAPGKGETRSSEVVDANAALRLNPKKLELEGRIDLIRIGRDDLRAMLDAWDPNHSDESANRTRQALLAGYPKDVRIGFHQGFTEVRMEMGGLAGLSKLDPIQLSTGPILQKYVAPYLKLTKPNPAVAKAPAATAQGTP